MPPEKKEVNVISTGSREIDDKMGGGVPHGSMTLIEGDSHSGKSVLTQQMSWGSLHDGFRLSFFSTENTVKSLVRQMQSLNIDILDYLLVGRLRLFPMEISQAKSETMGVLLEAIKTEGKRGSDMGRAAIVGTPAEVTDVVGQYRDAGADELIVPDFTMGPMARRQDTCDLFINEVASHFR